MDGPGRYPAVKPELALDLASFHLDYVRDPSELERVTILPPGPIDRTRKVVVGKFSFKPPQFDQPKSRHVLSLEKQAPRIEPEPQKENPFNRNKKKEEDNVSKLRAQAVAKDESLVPHLLDSRGPDGALLQRGTVEAARTEKSTFEYFVFVRVSKGVIRAYPADMYLAFRPHIDRAKVHEEAVAARQRAMAQAGTGHNGGGGFGGGGGGFGLGGGVGGLGGLSRLEARLVPKTVRAEMQAREARQRELELSKAARRFKDDLDDVGVGRSRLTKVAGGEDDEDAGRFSDDDEDGGLLGGKGRRRTTTADGEALGEDEVQEDTYAGIQDDLRPEKPEEAEDWEHDEAPQDDDQDQGADSEVYDDDPGMRKKLGLEEEEEEEDMDESKKKLLKHLDQDTEEEEEPEEQPQQDIQQQQDGAGEGDEDALRAGGYMDEDEDDLDDDDDGLDRWASMSLGLNPTASAAAQQQQHLYQQQQQQQQRQKSPSPGAAPTAPGPSAAPSTGVKRKATTPGARGSTPAPAGGEEDSQGAAKRARASPAPAALAAAAAAAAATRPAGLEVSPSPTPSPGPPDVLLAAAAVGAVGQQVTDAAPAKAPGGGAADAKDAEPDPEQMEFAIQTLRSAPGYTMTIKEFTAKTKAFKGASQKDTWKKVVLKIATSKKDESGTTMILLRAKYHP